MTTAGKRRVGGSQDFEDVVLGDAGLLSRHDVAPALRYKSPAYVNLDFTPTFTPALLLKDFDLGFEAAGEMGVPMPVAATARESVRALIDSGYTDVDFAALIELQARASGLELVADQAPVADGLAHAEPAERA